MSTLRRLISNVRSMHRIMSTDAMITDRAIASEIRNNTLLLVKRETNLRKLWATDTIFETIPCLEMIEVPISECSTGVEDLLIARSKFKIPRIAEGNYKYLIQGVWSINVLGGRGKRLKEISINRYLNLLKLSNTKNEEYFWIHNDYLYVTSAFVQMVRMSALFEPGLSNQIRYAEGCDCCDIKVEDEEYCMNPLDREFYLPGYLEKQVLDLTAEKLLKTYFRVQGDISNEGIDGQQINTSPTN